MLQKTISRRFNSAFSIIELIAVIVVLGLISAFALANFTGVLRESDDETVKINLTEIAKLSIADTRIDGALTLDSVSNFSSDFQDINGNQYLTKTGSSTSTNEISIYIPQSLDVIYLAALSRTGNCIAVRYPQVGQPQVIDFNSVSCDSLAASSLF